jgi:hypothetical protein
MEVDADRLNMLIDAEAFSLKLANSYSENRNVAYKNLEQSDLRKEYDKADKLEHLYDLKGRFFEELRRSYLNDDLRRHVDSIVNEMKNLFG